MAKSDLKYGRSKFSKEGKSTSTPEFGLRNTKDAIKGGNYVAMGCEDLLAIKKTGKVTLGEK